MLRSGGAPGPSTAGLRLRITAQHAPAIAEAIAAPLRVHDLVTGIHVWDGRLDIAVNNAGGSPAAPAATASARFSEKVIALNLTSALQVAQEANVVMQPGDGGTIVNVVEPLRDCGRRPAPRPTARPRPA